MHDTTTPDTPDTPAAAARPAAAGDAGTETAGRAARSGTDRRRPDRTPAARTGLLARTGRLAASGLAGFPLAVAAVPMALVGAGGAAARAQRRALGWAFDGSGSRPWPTHGPGVPSDPGSGVRRAGAARVLGHSLAALLPSLLAFALTALCLWGVYSGYLYPLRPDAAFALDHPFRPDGRFRTSWGGPTLVGAWSIHALVVLGWHVLSLPVLRGLAAARRRLADALLGS